MRHYEFITERKKKRKKSKKSMRAYGGYWYPGFAYGSTESSAEAGGDGGGESVREGEVLSLGAKRSPLVVAGSPYDWDIYDLRTNKMVANILGGDRHDSPLYEIRIRSSGMTPTTRMLPTYVLRAGPNNNPPYKAYELVAPEGGFGKVEKSPGPGGTTKLRPDQDDMLRHLFKNLGGGKYYGYDLVLVEEGLDQYELIEKALGAKIMEIDFAMELGYTDWDPEDSSSIVYLGNKVNITENLDKENTAQEVNKFLNWASKKLNLKRPPKIELSYDTEEAQQGHHTGRHVEGSDSVWVYAANRNLVDILRTVFHELVHVRQGELGMIKDGDSYPGSPIEAMADMLAGKYIKIYGKANRKVFQ